MKTKLMIVGAGGHGRVIADIAALCGYAQIDFLDDSPSAMVSAAGTVAEYTHFTESHDFVIGIGNNAGRRRLTEALIADGATFATLIHPAATIGSNVHIGEGTVIMAGAVINAGAVLGAGVIINTCASVDHDCIVGDFVHISVDAHLAGTVTVGAGCMIGIGASVINNLSLCADCIIGAGAVVVKSIKTSGTYIGIPAKRK